MLENTLLLVATNLSNFVSTSFASWTEIAGLLDINNQLDLSREALSPGDLATISLEESKEWATQYHRLRGTPPSEEDLLTRENEIVEAIKYYYTPERIVSEQLDIESLVNDMNKWSLRGPDRPYLFGNIPDKGVGLHYFKSDIGISFTAHAPFMIPYIELFYDRTRMLADRSLQEIGGLDVIESIVQLQYKLNKKVIFSIDDDEVLSEEPYRVY